MGILLKSVLFSLLLISTSGFAEDSRLRITSFIRDRPRDSRMFELCGILENGPANPVSIRVEVDPGLAGSGEYNTSTGPTGRFCLTVLSVTARVRVTAYVPGGEIEQMALETEGDLRQ